MTDFVDDRDNQQTLDVGRDCLATQDREPELAGSAAFQDDTPTPPDPGEQSRATPEESEEQRTLDQENAVLPPEWSG